MSNLTIGEKISLVCVALLFLGLLQGTISLITGSRAADAVKAVTNDSLPSIIGMSNVSNHAKDQRAEAASFLQAASAEERTQIEKGIADLESKLQEELKGYIVSDAQDRANLDKLKSRQDQFMRAWEKVKTLASQGKQAAAQTAFHDELLTSAKERRKVLIDMVEYNRVNAVSSMKTVADSTATGRLWVWIMMGITVVVGSVLALFLIRGINRTLTRVATELKSGSEQVASASGQVSSSSQSLAQGASEQAASLEETSASSEEITSMTRKNAENSRAAANLTGEACELVTTANHNLEQMVGSMAEINSSSDKISKIIKVIDEIAFQTNILALNAAVEAARAGEAGMGFAVVADEVRNLAQRCAQAAKDTAGLIEDSIAKSAAGKTKLDRVAKAIHDITSNVTQIKTLVDEVKAGSEEQARGIEQIARALSQMEQVTQKTAANAEESASASEELNAQAAAMNDVVNTLQQMVGGSGSDQESFGSHHTFTPVGSRRGRHGPNRAEAPAHTAFKRSANQTRIATKVDAPVPVAARARNDFEAFPLDEDFKEF